MVDTESRCFVDTDDLDFVHKGLLTELTQLGGPSSDAETVTFTAIRCTPEGRFERRERSRFLRKGETGWQYGDGDALSDRA